MENNFFPRGMRSRYSWRGCVSLLGLLAKIKCHWRGCGHATWMAEKPLRYFTSELSGKLSVGQWSGELPSGVPEKAAHGKVLRVPYCRTAEACPGQHISRKENSSSSVVPPEPATQEVFPGSSRQGAGMLASQAE